MILSFEVQAVRSDAALLGIDGDDGHFDLVADRDDLTRMRDAPVELAAGDVEES